MKFLRSCANTFSIISESADDTFRIGEALGSSLYPGLLILLKGGLGMGKTRLVQGIGKAVGYERVKSPSFVIMNEYDAEIPFLHADLYRLEGEGEADALGIDEYLDEGFAAAVEWAERWRSCPDNRLEIDFLPVPEDCGSRVLLFCALGNREAELLAEIKKKLLTEGELD